MNRKGLTLVEIVIALGLLGFILGITFYFLNIKMRESVRESGISTSMGDIGFAKYMLTWDIWMAGYGLRNDVKPIDGGKDSLILRASAFVDNSGKWSYSLSQVKNTDTIYVFRWDEVDKNFKEKDSVIFLTHDGEFVAGPLEIDEIKDTIYPTTGSTTPAQKLIVSGTINLFPIGGLIFKVNTYMGTYREIKYKVVDENLMRDTTIIIDNIRSIRFWYAIDESGHGNIVWIDSIPPSIPSAKLSEKLKLVRVILVRHSRRLKNYNYPKTSIDVKSVDGDSVIYSIPLSSDDRKMRWTVLDWVVKPRNLFK